MKLNVRVHSVLREQLPPGAVASRVTFAFRRLAPNLRRLKVHVTPTTGKSDKLTVCRAHAVLTKGGRLYAVGEGPTPRHAVDSALERLHSLTRRQLTLGEFHRRPSVLRAGEKGASPAYG